MQTIFKTNIDVNPFHSVKLHSNPKSKPYFQTTRDMVDIVEIGFDASIHNQIVGLLESNKSSHKMLQTKKYNARLAALEKKLYNKRSKKERRKYV